jgi:hypothetical protein
VRAVFLFLLLVLTSSCFNQGDCVITATNKVKIALQKKLDGTPRSTVFLSIEEVHGADTLLISTNDPNNPTLVTTLTLPLNPNYDSTTFVMLRDDSTLFHLTLGYSTYTKIIATDCGAFLYYEKLKVKHTDFDSTRIVNSQLLINVSKNLQLYF